MNRGPLKLIDAAGRCPYMYRVMTSASGGVAARTLRPRSPFRALIPLIVLALAAPAAATTLVRLSLERMVSASDTIVEGRVDGTRSFWQGKQILTEVTLAVARSLKGKADAKLIFVQLGGTVMQPVPITLTVPGAPVQSAGDQGFYFLAPGLDGRKVIVGLSQGRVLERQDETGAFVNFQGRRRTPGEFADEIRRILAGQAPSPASPGTHR